jgi:hypothetical protein
MMKRERPEFDAPGEASERAEMHFSPAEHSQMSTSEIDGVIDRHSRELLAIDGVHGVGVGRTPIGDTAVRIDIDNESVRSRLPREVDGYPVEVAIVPGGFDILPAAK